jgi:formylglycine-generating enzyme
VIDRAAASLLGLATALACPSCSVPQPQWLVVLSTDAQVPHLGDRVLVEVDGAACAIGCSRILRADTADAWPISFGVMSSSLPLRIRARLFRASASGEDGEPVGSALIDSTGALPPARAGITRVALYLRTSCFGALSDPAQGVTCDPATGALVPVPVLRDGAPLVSGSWAPGVPAPCAGDAPLGMACVPGGALLFGDPAPRLVPDEESALPEQLVVVRPFFLDAREVSVGDFRALVASGAQLAAPVARDDPSLAESERCTFTSMANDADAGLPLNCIGLDLAASICGARGARLPTEAEWEMAASNGDLETRYPWGFEDDVCARAIVGRGVPPLSAATCRSTGHGSLPAGPADTDRATMDATSSGVSDLGGNLGEWTSDLFERRGVGYWASDRVLIDPRCTQGDGSGRGVARGGSWASPEAEASAVTRKAWRGPSARIGVRCAVTASAGLRTD